MKTIYFIILVLLTSTTLANEIEFIGSKNLIVHTFYHVSKVVPRTLQRDFYAIRFKFDNNDEYSSTTFLKGHDCAKSPITGFIYSSGYSYKYLDFGFLVGGYNTDLRYWRNGQYDVEPFTVRTMNANIVPLAGVEFNLKLDLNKNISLRLNNIVTPAMNIHVMGISFSF